jgi:phosphate/phosphite/phosphonate ABC transporter binding protein
LTAVTPQTFAIVTDLARTRAAFEVFCQRLETATGFRISPSVYPSYASLIEEALAGRLDLAWSPPLVAVRLRQAQAAAPIAVVRRSSRTGYHSALFARADGPLRRPGDLRGLRAAWVSPESASGYFAPRWHLRSLGVDPKIAFVEESFLGSHEAVAEAVLGGKADVGATHVGLDPSGGSLTSAPWMTLGAPPTAIRVLLLIGPIPGDVIIASRKVPPGTRRRLTAALLTLRGDDAADASQTVFDSTRFEPVSEDHLRLLERLQRHESAS